MASADTETLLTGSDQAFLSQLYARYLDNPGSVDPSWKALFDELGEDPGAVKKAARGASWAPRGSAVNGGYTNGGPHGGNGAAAVAEPEGTPAEEGGQQSATGTARVEELRQAQLDSIRALMLIRAYRVRGHLVANLDPLGLQPPVEHPELDPKTYGFTDEDWDRPIFINNVLGLETATLREILDALTRAYCGYIGVEYTHIQDPDEKSWLQQRIEGAQRLPDYTVEDKRMILDRVTSAETFEKFLNTKYPGAKRFGLDGADSAIPAIYEMLRRGAELGGEEFVFGMPHRGRLNVLCNIMGKPYRAVFAEFEGISNLPDDIHGSGDVKYHLGTSADRDFDGRTVHLSLTANPSHLEAVNPVVAGKVRAKQAQREDQERIKVVPITLHGDAAFAGQGMVPEVLAQSQLKGYRIGGTIHLIVNNQIGFTTSPSAARPGPYPTDVALGIQAPIFHVNGDNPEAVAHAARVCIEYRQRFKKDVVLDMFCYRRHGHNESDEPSFTQPLMYKAIAQHATVRESYAKLLSDAGILSESETEGVYKKWMDLFSEEFEASKSYRPNKADWLEGAWTGMEVASGGDRRGRTAVPLETLLSVGEKLTEVPEGFSVHSKIARQLKQKRQAINQRGPIDWATGEALAFGTLLVEGTPVRLSGQDSARGTFSQRHSVLIDQNDGSRFIPLNNLAEDQSVYEPIDSPLSEQGVLGFEYGYTQAEPNALVLWEAQFGDFVNGAQVIIDQFITSAEHKWLRMSGIVMLLPHGYEGQGPEHSSGRPERFLQLCAEDNIQVANCTTPANYFHILRRQMRRPFRKPLILMTPKSLLRHKLAVSSLAEMTSGTSFHRVLPESDSESLVKPGDMRRVVLCSGKVYYDLYQKRQDAGVNDVALIRVEQLYPWPRNSLIRELRKYPKAQVVWCQEEPANMGAWFFVDRRLEDLLRDLEHPSPRPIYAGRKESAAPATGIPARHQEEQRGLVDAALGIG